ncbi:tRNA (guanosine(37)-N1)-methyltransferase TrmD [Candidatus Gottesmanbacteria bacterium RIFCSPHIGHO2_02_FULL_40_24]|uniref:tRNA (guanine-N(1)-)-methyltransferase n=1 Tax=Candidatus Gottesmanbacteria bacterium RIFCSPHIGHO2_01_FULL_40_15 TaxID=1798376 RepID=A0A1F5Z496_9BACT|nr:MAG: tRNA (guanosine(37)-N1)-methyltransferase TrmD [Candidatus Gottesmanbacteria bacterium RIFCSPHIGHO2_01_FULL_40_15]OGG17192.1 MAG: tRNA (guanosine(37)-N1)-methyltransferase TrmD [Candidatus Gottesmanbacteria bacterium RIFCSPHIGHO2_02_FULL_40_24]OGG22369.1 MAG: tRNA (guanosine(37)-N1)-methyltransferase TrmD [Candidatus Gottesmanbacteria bacterium RIFCSPLOWO2_01_FULL_40_10]OGG23586.1 MAG: tRNA (guanosine(37)-N1)-methyltransferase TrmD [Candidatus Gottesmanbacteria bacterium RIFCSPHIGHO2_12_
MVISILTLFPQVFSQVVATSIIGRAKQKKLVNIRLINIRDFSKDKHRSVDDRPYGGGAGMLLRVDIVYKALEAARIKDLKREKVFLLDPAGNLLTQKKIREMSEFNHLILICGHYEGIDERICHFIDEKISIGEYILTGGEIPAMVITDAVVRLIPKVLEKPQSTIDESFTEDNQLEAPQYTRPVEFMGLKVPEILLSGNHAQINKWRSSEAKKRTGKSEKRGK